LHTKEVCVIYRHHNNQITDSATTLNSRVEDGLKAFIEKEKPKSGEFQFITEILFQARLYKQKKLLNMKANSFKEKLVYTLYKEVNRMGHILTGTSWEHMQVVNIEAKVFKTYMKRIA
jgi:hypothetical protein